MGGVGDMDALSSSAESLRACVKTQIVDEILMPENLYQRLWSP